MEGVIVNFRVGMKTMSHNHMIVSVKSLTKRADAAKLVGKNVIFTTPAKNQIKGKIASAHGNKGALRVIFEKAMPGQAIGKNVPLE
jgi:large subunit ribosomal protein L35Ae